MWDHQTVSWWQEIGGEAIISELAGLKLEVLPLSMVSWEEFKGAFPDGKVLSRDTGIYTRYDGRTPYKGYDTQLSNIGVIDGESIGYDGLEAPCSIPFFYTGPRDPRLPMMDRVVGLSVDGEALAVPFSRLEVEPVLHLTLAGRDMVVFFKRGTASALDAAKIAEGRDVGATGVFESVLGGRRLTFRAEGGMFLDGQTGSTWNIFGHATSGPLEGEELTPVPHLGGQLWFSWVAFHPDTMVYGVD